MDFLRRALAPLSSRGVRVALVGLIVAWVAEYGYHPQEQWVTAAVGILSALILQHVGFHAGVAKGKAATENAEVKTLLVRPENRN